MTTLKELISYITNQFKFWFIIKEWESGLQLRNGKINRELSAGFYFKVPIIDYVFAKPKRVQDCVVSQVNFTTKDNKQITASAAAFFKITNIKDYYNGYAEPLSIIDNIIKNQINKYFLNTYYKDFIQEEFEAFVLNHLKTINSKGFDFVGFNLTTFSNARTYRFINDKLYSQDSSKLDDQLY